MLGQRVLELRTSKRMSQTQLAKRTGGRIDQTAVSRIERGATPEPSVFTVALIARVLDTPVEDLLNLDQTMPAVPETVSPLPEGPVAAAIALLQAQLTEIRNELRELRGTAPAAAPKAQGRGSRRA